VDEVADGETAGARAKRLDASGTVEAEHVRAFVLHHAAKRSLGRLPVDREVHQTRVLIEVLDCDAFMLITSEVVLFRLPTSRGGSGDHLPPGLR
jgi:hypothetical protein